MKKTFKNYLLVILSLLVLFSCNDDEPMVENHGGELIKVTFKPGGEFDLIGESPIDGRTENELGTIYGVAIWKVIDGTTFYETEGVFNDLSKIDYEFYSDESYEIFFSAVNPGTSEGITYYEDAGDTILKSAFGESRVLNRFSDFVPANNIYSAVGFEVDINRDSSYNFYSLPMVDKFDGFLTINNPTEADSVITVNLKRISFGLAFKVANIDNNDQLKIKFGQHTTDYQLDSLTNEQYQIRSTNYSDSRYNPIPDEYETNISVTLELDIYDEFGNPEREKILTTREIAVKRNVKRTYLIDLNDFADDGGAQRSGWDLNYLDGDFVDEGELQFPD